MVNIYLYFLFMIFIIILSTINAFYVIYAEDTTAFFKFLSFVLVFLLIYLSSFKETFLPFLGNAIYPISLIPSAIHPKKTNFSVEVKLNYPDGSKVIYWAANASDANFNVNVNDIKSPMIAYGDYNNSGIAIINNKKTTLHLNCPDKYKIPSGKVLDKHLHYRVAIPNNPILSNVKTLYINC